MFPESLSHRKLASWIDLLALCLGTHILKKCLWSFYLFGIFIGRKIRYTDGKTDSSQWFLIGNLTWPADWLGWKQSHQRSPLEKQQWFWWLKAFAAVEFTSREQFKALEIILPSFKSHKRTKLRFFLVFTIQFSAAASPSLKTTSQSSCFLKWPPLFHSYSTTQVLSPQLLQHFENKCRKSSKCHKNSFFLYVFFFHYEKYYCILPTWVCNHKEGVGHWWPTFVFCRTSEELGWGRFTDDSGQSQQ